jgi:hypothetical protein
VTADATIFTGGSRPRRKPPARWNARMAVPVPCPSASGAIRSVIRPTIRPPIVVAIGISQ